MSVLIGSLVEIFLNGHCKLQGDLSHELSLLQEVMALLGIAGSTSPAPLSQPDFLSSHGSIFHVAASETQHGAAGSSSCEQDHMLEEPSSASSSQHTPQYHPRHVIRSERQRTWLGG